MDEQSDAPRAGRTWDRPRTRRAILGGGAAIAAAGAAAAIVGVTTYDGGGKSQEGSGDGAGQSSPPRATPTPDPNRQIAEPARRAAHLLRRAGFGGTPAEVDEFAKLTRAEAADRLVNFEAVDNSALNARLATMNLELNDYGNGLIGDMQRWWLTRMVYTARPLEERMTYIWHGLLTSQLSKVGNQKAKLLVKQNELFRANALPKFDTLIKAVSRDPAMLNYLDLVDSTKEHPNENYARELMELFTIGVGNYTEDDVRESARAFTGWRVTQPPRQNLGPNPTQQERNEALRKAAAEWDAQFQFVPRLHDSGTKTFLGTSGAFDGDDIIDILMQQKATGRYITTRLFTEFANYNPEPKTIDRLAGVWESSGHQIKDVVREILVSDEFYSERSYRGFVRSPIEFLVGAMRGLGLESDFRQLANGGRGRGNATANAFRGMDQVLFEPHNVAGWPGGSTWLSSSTFFARVNFADQLLFPNGRPTKVPALAGASTTEDMVSIALDRLVDGNTSPTSREALTSFAASIKAPDERAATVAYLVLSSPEYQLA